MTTLCSTIALLAIGFFAGMLFTYFGLESDKKQARKKSNKITYPVERKN